MKKVKKTVDETLRSILGEDQRSSEDKDKLEMYIKLKNEKDEGNEKVTELFFQNVNLGKERAKIEKEIKLLQAKAQTLKSAESYLELLAEEVRKRISETSEMLRILEEEPEIKEYLQKLQTKKAD